MVLPINLIGDLVANQSKPVIQAKSNRVKIGTEINSANGQEEDKFMFIHDSWNLVKEVKIIIEKL